MSENVWTPGTATATGSLPGTDPVEAARVAAGALPELMPFPELPARGVGADVLGRTAGMLVDLAAEVVPSGYRVARHPGRDQRRAKDLLRWDLDAVEQAVAEEGPPRVIKVQAAGPWTLGAGVELERGHRVLTDHGALRDFAESLTLGLVEHVSTVRSRIGVPVVVQLDEPSLPAVLRGGLSTPSGYGTVAPVPAPEAQRLLSEVVEELAEATGAPVAVHCCAARPPVGLLQRAGAGAIALDATRMGEVVGPLADEIGEAWEGGVALLLGLVPSRQPAAESSEREASERESPGREPSVHELAMPAHDLASRLGFPRRVLAQNALPTPVCGLAGASAPWSRRALALARDLGSLFRDEADQ